MYYYNIFQSFIFMIDIINFDVVFVNLDFSEIRNSATYTPWCKKILYVRLSQFNYDYKSFSNMIITDR